MGSCSDISQFGLEGLKEGFLQLIEIVSIRLELSG